MPDTPSSKVGNQQHFLSSGSSSAMPSNSFMKDESEFLERRYKSIKASPSGSASIFFIT